jgi:hypothetical protein
MSKEEIQRFQNEFLEAATALKDEPFSGFVNSMNLRTVWTTSATGW